MRIMLSTPFSSDWALRLMCRRKVARMLHAQKLWLLLLLLLLLLLVLSFYCQGYCSLLKSPVSGVAGPLARTCMLYSRSCAGRST